MTTQYDTPKIPTGWADSRNTHDAVAMALHAIADSTRSAEAIWDMPTPAECDHVEMAVENYVANRVFSPEPDGRYQWGDEAIIVTSSEDSA